jgi:nitrogenase molybdenum-iron protein alpha/beta subunit
MLFDPDGFIGTLLAIEGISDARAVLNGPTGCRGNPAYFSDRHFPRENSLNRRSFEEPFFFGQSRIPCTYLDRDDYIMGSGEKLTSILRLIAEMGDTFLAIVNSPGACLIGDDLNRFLVNFSLANRCMAIESAAYSRPFAAGFDDTIAAILRWLRLNKLQQLRNRVNLLGISMYQKYWQGNIAEIRHLCHLMGLEVVSIPGGGCSVAQLRESVTASYNIVIFPEYAKKTASFYEKEFDIPAIYPPCGSPVGFGPTEEWIKTVARVTKQNPTQALDYMKEKELMRIINYRDFIMKKDTRKGLLLQFVQIHHLSIR